MPKLEQMLPSKTYASAYRRLKDLEMLQRKLRNDPNYSKKTMKVIDAAITDLWDRMNKLLTGQGEE